MIEALSSHATQKPLDDGIHPGRAWCSQHNLDVGARGNSIEQGSALRVSVPNQNLRSFPERRGLTQLLRRPLLRRRAGHTDVRLLNPFAAECVRSQDRRRLARSARSRQREFLDADTASSIDVQCAIH